MIGSHPICPTIRDASSIASWVSSGTGPSGAVRFSSSLRCRVPRSMSARMIAVSKARPRSRTISSMISSVHSTCSLAPAPPADPMITGMSSSRPEVRIGKRSFFVASLLTLTTPAPSFCGPASVDPASTAITSGCLATPFRKEVKGNP